jgi:hypothetical protein
VKWPPFVACYFIPSGRVFFFSLSFFPWCFLLWVFSAFLVLSDAFSFFLFCLRALCCLGLFYVGLFSVRTFFFLDIVRNSETPKPKLRNLPKPTPKMRSAKGQSAHVGTGRLPGVGTAEAARVCMALHLCGSSSVSLLMQGARSKGIK